VVGGTNVGETTVLVVSLCSSHNAPHTASASTAWAWVGSEIVRSARRPPQRDPPFPHMDMLHSLSRRAVLSLTAAACVTLQKPAPARAAIPGIVEYCIPGVTAERCRGTFWETGKLYKKAEGVAMTQAEYSQALTELDSLGTELKRLGQLADDGLAGEVGAGAAKTRVALRQAGERVILALVGDDRLDSNRRLLLVIAVLDDVDREALSQPATSRSNAAAGFAPLRLMLDSASRRFEDFRKALPAQPADVEDI